MSASIPPPDLYTLLAPILPSLPAAAASTEPASGVLPLLSPILRQRVRLLSDASTEPWLRLLCYDQAKGQKLTEAVRGTALEPHPVSGEVEVDWDYDAEIRYRRLDRETIQALVALASFGLAFQLVYCVGDVDGGGDGWRVGEVSVPDTPSPFSKFGGATTITEADRQFKTGQVRPPSAPGRSGGSDDGDEAMEEDDGGYWDQYDATPPQTPGKNQPPTPPRGTMPGKVNGGPSPDIDDEYFAQYDHVQPAMDNHDPDEEAQLAQVAPPLGLSHGEPKSAEAVGTDDTNGSWTLAGAADEDNSEEGHRRLDKTIIHPRPESSASSSGSRTVAKLEATADRQGQHEFGVKQHVSRSIRNLYLLSRASGIDREEFERMVKSELEVLALVEDQD
ncbi:hypothetical protein S40285_01924 [Stachybotrys chlorohalonatus IBT 40285]|uniref:Uncharacterized protein n=1 Tax=Stachybotrys chlorohalonatus (strain IBT 40285) TaxID=1283841 RepID=A0A084QQU1_STAC4|nr:hypothetical protein S40285_01924 [Stachybotrys chlorohalonata IBT 40285]